MASLVIRAATTNDILSIVKVRSAALAEDEIRGFSPPEFAYTSTTERLREVWSSGNRLKDGFEVFVAEEKGKLVGYTIYKVADDSGYIDDIVVAKEEQGKGIGKALIGYVESAAKSKGCSHMKNDTTENANGIAWRSYGFWIKMGYEDTGERLPTRYSFKEIPFVKSLK